MSEGAQSDQEKTEDPSARRLARAEEQGDLPQSADLSAALQILSAGALLGADGASLSVTARQALFAHLPALLLHEGEGALLAYDPSAQPL